MFRRKLNSLFCNVAKSTQVQTNSICVAYNSSKNVCSRSVFNKSVFCDNLVKCRYYSSNSENSDDKSEPTDKQSSAPKVKAGVGKYKIFSDYESPVILDVDEERQLRLKNPELFEVEEEKPDEFSGISLERGENGVFDVEELVDILRKENAQDICVIAIPPEFQYVDHMVIVSGRSLRHLTAMAEFIKKLYKRKKAESDYFPVIEGKTSKEWMAMDLGNIALHLQTKDCRMKYDIETLWAVGSEFDDKINEKEDQYITLLKQHTALADLEPLDHQEPSKPEINNSLG